MNEKLNILNELKNLNNEINSKHLTQYIEKLEGEINREVYEMEEYFGIKPEIHPIFQNILKGAF